MYTLLLFQIRNHSRQKFTILTLITDQNMIIHGRPARRWKAGLVTEAASIPERQSNQLLYRAHLVLDLFRSLTV